MRAVTMVAVAAVLARQVACSGGDKKMTIPADGPGSGSGMLPATLGAHALVFQRVNGGLTTISTPALASRPSGSTIVVGVGRGAFSAFSPPTDNKGNAPYRQLGSGHTYTLWPDSGTAVYAFADAKGGDGHVISTSTPASDETTLTVVEVAGTTVQDFKWNEVLKGRPSTSLKVTTSGPAMLVAFWWGDAGVNDDKTAVPNNGFQVIDSVLASGALVQCAVAVKEVSAAGSYDVTWTSTPLQGAQLWIVAIQ